MKVNRDKNNFYVEKDGAKAIVEYSQTDELLIIHHTEVPSHLENQGIASSLLSEAAQYAQENDLLIKAECRFAKDYLERKEEFMGLLAKH
ncbi:MAG TPA: GNAT family N-acetyltransferase [Anditalea sp.]|nr:GNAT family N-acetyltransferase [Anditalea sp.]